MHVVGDDVEEEEELREAEGRLLERHCELVRDRYVTHDVRVGDEGVGGLRTVENGGVLVWLQNHVLVQT